MVNCKVILTGHFGVGKTSLFNQFLYQKFDDRYLTTIGVKVDKKVVTINNQEVTMMLWDIAGEVNQNKVPVNYFLGAAVIIFVFDLTRPSTWKTMQEDLDYLKKINPNCIIKVIGNKNDLVSTEKVTEILKEIEPQVEMTTSAKTGENINPLFDQIATEILLPYESSK